MSADNYMYVLPTKDGRFQVQMRWASIDYEDDSEYDNSDYEDLTSNHVFATIQEAMDSANLQDSGGNDEWGLGCEYGVSVSPKIKLKITYEVRE